MPDKTPIRRCAIYVRKSSEEGLDMSYNSLEAQTDALALAKQYGMPALCRALYNSNEFIRLN